MSELLKRELPKCPNQKPEDKYLKLCSYHGQCYFDREEVIAHNLEINKDGFVWTKLYFWAIKSEFYIIAFVTKMFFTLLHHLNIQNPKGLTKARQKLRFGPLTIVILAKIFQIQHYVNEMRTGSEHGLTRTQIKKVMFPIAC